MEGRRRVHNIEKNLFTEAKLSTSTVCEVEIVGVKKQAKKCVQINMKKHVSLFGTFPYGFPLPIS